MAVRKIPYETQLVDLGLPEETPMDKLNQFIQTVGGVAQGVSNIRATREANNIAGMNLLEGLIDTATNSNQINEYKKIYENNIDTSHVSFNNEYNIKADILDAKFKQKELRINNFESSSQEFSNMLYSTDNVFNTSILNLGQEELEDLFKSMSKDDLKGWMQPSLDARDDIVRFRNNMKSIYGDKSPDFEIAINGQKRKFGKVMQDLNRFDETIDALVNKALDDGVLSPQEAREIALIRPSQNVGSKYVKDLFDAKRVTAAGLMDKGGELINNDALRAVQKVVKEGGDIRTQVNPAFVDLFENKDTGEVVQNNIPLLEEKQIEMPDGTIKRLETITHLMPPEEKKRVFLEHLAAEQIDQSVLNTMITNIFSESNRMQSAGMKMFRAYGGMEDYFGPTDPAPEESVTHTSRVIGTGYTGPYAPPVKATPIPKIETKDIKKIPLTTDNLDKYLGTKPKRPETPIAVEEDFKPEEYEVTEPGTVEIPPTPTGVAKNLPEEFFTFIPFSENISNEMLEQTNNPYAITWGKKAEKYGGRKSERTFKGRDGKTYHYAEFDNYEHGMTSGKNIAADMWNEEGGNVEKFWTRYIGQTADSTEVKSRVRWTNDILKRYSPDYEEKVSPKIPLKFFDKSRGVEVIASDKQRKYVEDEFEKFKNKQYRMIEQEKKWYGGSKKQLKLREERIKKAQDNLQLSSDEWWNNLDPSFKQKYLRIQGAKDMTITKGEDKKGSRVFSE